jgi:polyhydroxyalkanoate synthesis regulator phasin
MRDALKNYLTLASGLTEVGRQRAVAASKALVASGEAAVEQVGDLAEDLLETSRNNRKLITALVRSEVDKAIARVGPATAGEVQRLTGRLRALEATLRGDSKPAAKPAPAKPATSAAKPAAKSAATSATKPASKPAAKPAKAAAKSAAKSAAKPAKTAAKPAAKPAAKAAAKPAKAASKAAKPAKRAGS